MMRCIDSRSSDVYFNLAAEEYLLKHSAESCFLLWQAEPTVVLGRHQSVRAEADVAFARERHISLARRFSGGGAVYQDLGNLNFTFIETAEKPTFAHYLHSVVGFLNTLGISAKTDQRLGIYLDGKKISGSAQSVYKDRLLYHCTLLFETDLAVLEAALQGVGGTAATAVSSVRSPVTNLRGHLPGGVDADHFREQAFLHFLHSDRTNRRDTLQENELAGIRHLRDEKYATEGWIYNKL